MAEKFHLDRSKVISSTAYREEMRLRCQTEHLFLGHMLGYTLLNERVHGPAIRLYLQKDPSQPFKEQTRGHRGLQLDPRGTYKSTLKTVDSVQYIICWPEIRLFKLTATMPLATAFAGEITDHFVCAKKPKDIEKPYDDTQFCEMATDFQLLFPEFIITPSEKRVGIYTAPCRKETVPPIKEATVMAFSNEKTIAGWHFDVGDPDDIVDTVNSATPQSIAKVKKNWNINKKTLMPWAAIQYSGTRYDPFDLWGDMIEQAAQQPGRVKVLVRAALKLKSGKRLEPGQFPDESEMELLFPELLNYQFLKDEFEADYESFMTQYMNDAYGGNEVVFTKESMLQATVDADELPIAGEMVFCGRFAHKDKASMKYAGFAVGMMEAGRMYIVDVMRGSYKPSTLAHNLVDMAKRYSVHVLTIEETPGARKMEKAITDYAQVMNWQLQIRWTEQMDEDAVRDMRIRHTEPMISGGRLKFSAAISCLREVVKQFSNYTMLDETEIPDVVSRVAENLPQSVVTQEASGEEDVAWEIAKQSDLRDRIYGFGQYAAADPIVEEKPYAPPTPTHGLTDIMPGLNG